MSCIPCCVRNILWFVLVFGIMTLVAIFFVVVGYENVVAGQFGFNDKVLA